MKRTALNWWPRILLGASAAIIAVSAITAASAQEGYCVEDADSDLATLDSGVIKSYSINLNDEDSQHAIVRCADGETGVLKTVILADAGDTPVFQGGTWGGTPLKYTPPDSYTAPPDTSSSLGQLQQACIDADTAILELIDEIEVVWTKLLPNTATDPAIATLLQLRKGLHGVVMNATDWTLAKRLAFALAYDDGVGQYGKPEDVLTYFLNQIELNPPAPVAVPTNLRLVWAWPDDATVRTLNADTGGVFHSGFEQPDMVDAPDAMSFLTACSYASSIPGSP